MKIDTNPEKIEELLSRGVENIYPKEDFLRAQLKSGKQLKLYTGYDPTGATLHIGHGITMLKLRQFQQLGHKVIMLIGDFTGMIGDPTDKTSARQKLTREQVLANCQSYQKQAATILDFTGENPVEVKFNSDWLAKMSFADVVELASHFTVQQMLERDMFEHRLAFKIKCNKCNFEWEIKTKIVPGQGVMSRTSGLDLTKEFICKNCGADHLSQENAEWAVLNGHGPSYSVIPPSPVYLHEFLYPLMQGYDSVAMDIDGEVGGNDQTFNMLAGRDLMKDLKNKEKFVLTTKLLVDSSGKKMGKTEGNMVAFSDSPEDMFGKVMSWTDGMIPNGFELCTTLPTAEIAQFLKETQNPRDQKLRLAFEIVKTFLGEAEAVKAQETFIKTFSKKETPDEIPELKPTVMDVITVLVEAKICKSKSEARQVIAQGGVKINDKKVETIEEKVKSGDVVQKGSRFFVKIK